MKWIAPVLVSALGILWADSVLAAQAAQVDADNTPVYEGPGKRFQTVETLHKGEYIVVSNLPTEGFFKVRTPKGAIGWVSADVLVLKGAPPAPGAEPAAPSPPPSSSNAPVAEAAPAAPGAASPVNSKPKSQRLTVRLLGGMNFFSASDLNTLTGFDAVKNGFSFGGEVGVFASPRVVVLARIERVFKNVEASDTTNGNVYALSTSSIPLTLGVEWAAVKQPKFAVHLSAMGGLGLSTQLTSISTSEAAPNTLSVSSTPATFLGKVDFTWSFSKTVGVFVEAGYRYLQTSALSFTDSTIHGSSLYMVNGAFVPFPLTFSGPVVGLGLALNF